MSRKEPMPVDFIGINKRRKEKATGRADWLTMLFVGLAFLAIVIVRSVT